MVRKRGCAAAGAKLATLRLGSVNFLGERTAGGTSNYREHTGIRRERGLPRQGLPWKSYRLAARGGRLSRRASSAGFFIPVAPRPEVGKEESMAAGREIFNPNGPTARRWPTF